LAKESNKGDEVEVDEDEVEDEDEDEDGIHLSRDDDGDGGDEGEEKRSGSRAEVKASSIGCRDAWDGKLSWVCEGVVLWYSR